MKLKLLFIGFLLSSICLISCRDDFYDEGMVQEGLPIELKLSFRSLPNNIESRVGRDPIYENKVDNIYILAFDERGNVYSTKFCKPGSGLTYEGENGDKGYVTIPTRAHNNVKIVGIANVTEGTTSTAYSLTTEELDNIKNMDELESKVIVMRDNAVERYSIFMMTGMAKDGNGSTTINISENTVCSIQLERTDAKVKFVVKTDNPHPDTWKDFSFSPKTWIVKRVPSKSYLMSHKDGDYNDETDGYFNSVERPFEEIMRDETDSKIFKGGSFVFYMPENRKKYGKRVSKYSDRDAWNGVYENGDRKFTNANPNSTYVEMTGVLSYNEDGKNTNADVRFIVHLGYDNGDINDYNTNRNTFYTYTITVRGVDDIKTEVESGEVRPGYEGDVVNTERIAYVLDSHYDRCLIKLNPANLSDEGKIYWSVNTPFSRGVYEIPLEGSDKDVPKNLRDYRWIKFAINEDYNVDEGKYVKYPGDLNYNDPYPIPGKPNNQSSPYYEKLGYGDARLKDINQLMRHLMRLKKQGVNKEMTITAFIDEYLYFQHPLEPVPDPNPRSLWKLTSDKEDRVLYLIFESPKYSTDQNSSVVTAQYSFRQRTIRTIFNVEKPELETAWGLESVMETGRLDVGTDYVKYGDDPRNGRKNCLKWLVENGEIKWTDVIDTEGDRYKLKEKYNNAAFACLLRNRDIDGDNIVDADEVRWYLASIDQLTDIFLGEYALDEPSRLYPEYLGDRENQVKWHYTSSSYNKNEGKPWILWAEQGASRGGFNESNGAMQGRYPYRCVRNLGLNLDYPDDVPTELVSVSKETDGTYLIDLTNMNIKSRRASAESGVLPSHNDKSDINRPYAKFRVTGPDGVYPKPKWGFFSGWNYLRWEEAQTFNEIPDGYRIPNQRELLIMTTRMPSDAWNTFDGLRPSYFSQTGFSLKGSPEYSNARKGFMWDSSNNVFFLMNEDQSADASKRGYIRPIKDVPLK